MKNNLAELKRHSQTVKHRKLSEATAEGQITTSEAGNVYRRRLFRKKWLRETDCKGWIRQFKDLGVLYCTYCKLEVPPSLAELQKHGKSKKHQVETREARDARSRQQSSAAPPIPPWQMPEVKRRQAEWSVAMHAAVDSGFRGVDELCAMAAGALGAGRFAMTGEQCKAQVEAVIAPALRQDLKEDLQDAQFSLILDRTTNLVSDRSVAVCTR